MNSTDSNQRPQILTPDAKGVLSPHPLGLVEQSNDEYHGGPGVSKSHLDVMHESPLHYWAKYVDPNREPEEPTPAKILGSAIHSAVLEPDLFPSEFIESPDFNLRTNAGRAEFKAFKAEHPGCTILRPDDRRLCLAVRDAVFRHPVAPSLLSGGIAEQSFYATDPETGELIKCRVDYLHNDGGMIVDVKTTEDASPRGFGRSAANYRYPLQAAWYWDVFDAAFGEHPPAWVFLAVDKNWPHAVGVYFIEPEQVVAARAAGRADFLRILECRASGVWPDWGCEPQALQLPGWAT